jgi:hypothetical protein
VRCLRLDLRHGPVHHLPASLVPHQATFALSTMRRSRSS